MKKSRVTSAQYGEIVATLAKAERGDLVKALAEDLTTVTINKESTKILDEKANKIVEEIEKSCEKIAEGDVECDLLRKHVLQRLSEKYGSNEVESGESEEAPLPEDDENAEEAPAPAPVTEGEDEPED